MGSYVTPSPMLDLGLRTEEARGGAIDMLYVLNEFRGWGMDVLIQKALHKGLDIIS